MADEPIPIEEGTFTFTEPPRLLGSRCPSCGARFFPARVLCARDATECETVELGPGGTLHAFTCVREAAMGYLGGGSGGLLGQVDLDDGLRVQTLVVDAAYEDLATGDRMQLCLTEVRRDDESGRPVVSFAFRPEPR